MPKSRSIEPIHLDGRTLEGGGQLLRNAICLSALTALPVKITDIRGNRSRGGGLKPQHLACVNWLAHACQARVQGAEKGSRTLLFEPGKAGDGVGQSPAFKKVNRDGEKRYECRLDIGTAGSTGLALQAILPFILFSKLPSALPVRLTVSGGTNVSGSPSYEYITQVLLPTYRRIGFPEIQATLERRGWSQGGASIGSFTLETPPRQSVVLPAFSFTPESDEEGRKRMPLHLTATIIAAQSCHAHFRKTLLSAIHSNFDASFTAESENLDITCESSLHEKRMYLILVATLPSPTISDLSQTYLLGRDYLYDKKIKSHDHAATEMAENVCRSLADEVESGAFVDVWMRDQLVVFQALAKGKSELYTGLDGEGRAREPSLHAKTAEWVAKEILGVDFDGVGGCEGVGFGGELDKSTDEIDAVEKKLESLKID